MKAVLVHVASYIENDCSVIETRETDQKYNRNKSLIYCYHHPFEFMLFVSLYSFFHNNASSHMVAIQ